MTSSDRFDPASLREAAQAQLAGQQGDALEELHVHQIELEMQHQELQRIYEELEASHARYRRLFDDAPMAYLEVGALGEVTRHNRAAERLLGVCTDHRIHDFVERTHRPGFSELVNAAHAGELPLPARELLLHTPGGPRFVRISASPAADGHTLLALEDVTRMREAQEQLATSERRMRSFFDLAPDGIAVLRDEIVVFVNRSLCALLGATPLQLMQDGLHSTVVGDPSLFSRTEASMLEFVLRDLEGGEHAVEARTVDIDLDGRPARMWMIRDLTERRRMEARVARSERLASFGMLVSGVAHEINNPLSFVLANLEMMIDELSKLGHQAQVELAKDALEGGTRISAIVNDLRSFQRIDDELGPVDVNSVVVRTLRMAEPKVAHTTRVRQALGIVPAVVSNEGRLAQVLLNLVLNASQAMPQRPVDQNMVEVRTWAKDGEVCLLVEDNGNGIPKDKLRYLFDPFFTTRKNSGGTGLGLAISNGIVQQMGGFIDVQSEPGKGTRFVVHLPVSPRTHEPRPTPSPVAAPEPPVTPKARILVVDDEPAVARVVVRALRDFGQIDVVDCGRAAEAKIASSPDYDVILCDLVMDNGSGDELLTWLQEHRPAQARRLVFMSGMPHPEQQRPTRHRPTIKKPFNLAEVRQVVLEVASSARPLPATDRDDTESHTA